MDLSLVGRVALVTGASKGIGAGIAKGLAGAGAAVAVGYARDRAGAERVVTAIQEAGGRAMAIGGDLTRVVEAEEVVAKTVEAFGLLDIVVNNAAFFEYLPLADITQEHFHRHFDTNVLGPLLVTRSAVRHFPARGGSIINISSLSSSGNRPGRVVYSATKAALNAITRSLALELAERNIRVNGIMPGYTDTEGARSFGVPGSPLEAQLIAGTPLRRVGVPDDFAPVAVFLASEASGWITGELLRVSGGAR